MTPDEFRAWLKRHFPQWGGVARAAEYLGTSPTSVYRKREGLQVLTKRDERLCTLKEIEVRAALARSNPEMVASVGEWDDDE